MGILTGIRVLELSRILSGPYLTMCLGDMGADVVKVEAPHKGDDTRHWGPPFYGEDATYYLAVNRNKRSIAIDLKSDAGRELVLRLAERSDIVVENFRRGTIERLGLGYDALRARKPDIIMLRISAYGETGPRQDDPGYDLIAQATGGFMSVTGPQGGPPVKLGMAVGDLGAALFGLSGVLGALYHRTQTGEGQYLTTSLFEGQLALHIAWAQNYFANGETPQPMGTAHPNLAPYQAFKASDAFFIVAAGNDSLWERLCDALEAPELLEDPRFVRNPDRVANREVLAELLDGRFAMRPRVEWLTLLRTAGVPAAPIQTIAEVYDDPQTEATGLVQTLPHPVAGDLKQVGFPVHFAKTPAEMRVAPPLRGADAESVLRELGYDDTAIGELRKSGAVE